jgi:integrase
MKDQISVTDCKHPRYTHRVRFPGPEGKRLDRFFTNETDALTFAKEQRKETGETGTTFGSMAEDERAALAFWRAFSATATPTPPDLLSVLKDYKSAFLASKASVSVTEGIERFLAHQEADGSSPRHLASLKSRLKRLSDDKGDMLVSAITVGNFTEWLNGLRATRADKEGEKLTPVTRHNLSRSIRSFFVFAMDRGWTLSNPVPVAKRAKNKSAKLAKAKAPAVLLPHDVARFMQAVAAEAPRITAFWALKFFAGIRDAEAARMDWSMIDLKGKKIHLPAEVSKTGEARTVKILPNLAAWLRHHAAKSGHVAPGDMARRSDYRKVLASLATKDAKGRIKKVFVFPSNAARHSYGTYHLFHFRNAGETSLQLGHKSNPAMLWEHYANPAAEEHAPEFWEIHPKSAKNVIPMNQSTADKTRTASPKRRAAR